MNYSLQGFSFFPFGVSHWGTTDDKFWSPEHLKNPANRARLYDVENTNLLLGRSECERCMYGWILGIDGDGTR